MGYITPKGFFSDLRRDKPNYIKAAYETCI